MQMEKTNEGHGKFVSTLPLERGMIPLPLRLYQGVWIPEYFVPSVINAQRHFKAHPSDVFLVSYPKSGTTWLKAMAFAAMTRTLHSANSHHPLHNVSPHRVLPFLEAACITLEDVSELNDATTGDDKDDGGQRSYLIATHLPLPLLPDSIKSAGCWMIYICRDPKDVAISRWHFNRKMRIEDASRTTATAAEDAVVPLDKFINMFCDGVCPYGSVWGHVLGYWNESLRVPEKVLFLKYEEVLEDPMRGLLRVAEFMGCSFTEEEVAASVPAELTRLTSFDNLRMLAQVQNHDLENKEVKIPTTSFYRKGVAGDWENYLTPEMASRLDQITRATGAAAALAALGHPESEATAMDG